MGANGSLFGNSWAGITSWLRGKPKEEDRRSENRLPVHDRATLAWRTSAGPEESSAVNLIDISNWGFKVRCPHKIETGTQVWLTDSNGKKAEGSIVHTERDEDGYLLGAQAEWETPEARSDAERRLAAQRDR